MIRDLFRIEEHTSISCKITGCDYKIHVVAPMDLDVALNGLWWHWATKHDYFSAPEAEHEQKD